MKPFAKSSTGTKDKTDSFTPDNHQSLGTKIRNIIFMEDVNDTVNDEDSHLADVGDVVIFLSRHLNNNLPGEATQINELFETDIDTDTELNINNHNQNTNPHSEELTVTEKEQIINAISLLSRRRVPPVSGRTKTSESGAVRTRRTRSIELTSQSTVTEAVENDPVDGEDEDIQLLTSTFANILTLMSRRQVPPVSGRTTTSESGAARTRRTRSIELTSQPTVTEAVENDPVDGEDEDIQLLTSTFANILTLMSRRRVPPVSGRTTTSESGAARTRRTRSMGLFPTTVETETEDREIAEDSQLWESSMANILALMSRRRVPPVKSRTKTSESGAVRVYRVN